MPRKTKLRIIFAAIILASGYHIYFNSDTRRLHLTDDIYQELIHPDWSERILREKHIRANYGSADENMLYLVDVRRVSISPAEAIAYYEAESDRLGLRECHVDTFIRAQAKFEDEWQRMGLDIPQSDNIIVISQSFPTSSTIRRNKQ